MEEDRRQKPEGKAAGGGGGVREVTEESAEIGILKMAAPEEN